MDEKDNWETFSLEEKKRTLILRQKKTLDLFLERHAISQDQYEKSIAMLNRSIAADYSFKG